jgi:hypothetical protein
MSCIIIFARASIRARPATELGFVRQRARFRAARSRGSFLATDTERLRPHVYIAAMQPRANEKANG